MILPIDRPHILIIWPPEVPVYFNAGHRLPIFQVAAYLRKNSKIHRVTAIDAGALNYTWKDVGNLLASERFDAAVIMNDFGCIEGLRPFIRYSRSILPHCKLVTFGRLSLQLPGFFQRYDLDAIVASGDYEAGVDAAISNVLGISDKAPGVRIRKDQIWTKEEPGIFLPPSQWPFPDVKEIPYSAYERQYADDSRKFCGIPERSELVVLIARGCPVQCLYCEVPQHQGLHERRRPLDDVVNHIQDAFKQHPFEYVSFYAPTFTLNTEWVKQLCQRLIALGSRYPWKCVTTIHHLNQPLVDMMAASGCVRISVGLETLEASAQQCLPKVKRKSKEKLEVLASWCKLSNIELNCFVILGLPNQTFAGAKMTIDTVRSLGARVRPTIYAPYHEMTEDMAEDVIASFDRQFHPSHSEPTEDLTAIYSLVFGPEASPTQVMHRIPERA